VSTSGGAVSGTQATQAVAGTTVCTTTAAVQRRVAADLARNLAANSLANAGRGNTSTGSAVSISQKPWCRFRPSAISRPAPRR
jgi:multidrug efflux pump